MKKTICIVLSLILITSMTYIAGISIGAESMPASEGFFDRFKSDAELVFDDEFESNAIDSTKWSYSAGWGRNQELYGHVEDDNVRVENGNLVLTAREETRYNTTDKKEGYREVTSGEITTNGKAGWKNGLIEVRAKLPKGQGVYPAIWTMGYDYDIGGCNWPWSGEIDIMEAVGKGDTNDKNNDTWQTLHYARPNSEGHNSSAAHVAQGVGTYKTLNGEALNDDYHSFWLYFDNKVMIIGVDETMMKIMDLTTDELRAYTEYEQYLILGLQMGGGTATGDIPIEFTKNSVWEMLVDYVRVYKFDDESKYDDYGLFEAESFNTDNGVGTSSSLCSRDCVKGIGNQSVNSVITGLEQGTYDIYAAISTSDSESVYEPYIQGTQVEGVSVSTYEENPDGAMPYLGTVQLDEKLPFELVLKNTKAATTNNTNLEIDKYFFVKTTNEPNTVITSENCYKASDKIEVSNATEFASALSDVDFDGKVVLTNNITMTKNLSITKNLTIDLNGFTINCGTLSKPFAVSSESTSIKFQNGNFIVNGNNGTIQSFIALDGKTTAVEFNNVNVDFKAYKYKADSVLIGNLYTSGGKTITVNNSNFNFTGDNANLGTEKLHKGIFGATTINFTNSTFNGNGFVNLIYTQAPDNGNVKGFIFKNCTVENFVTVFNAGANATKTNPIKLAQTEIINCQNLANSDVNAVKFLPSTNNAIYTADNTEIAAADLTNTIGNIKYVCTHKYNDATCTSSKICKYCSLSDGEALGHTPGEAEITEGDCLHDTVSVVKCTTCGEIVSSEIVEKASGHEFTVQKIGEDTCTTSSYYKRTCTKCGHYETFSGTNGRPFGKTGHVVDTATVVPFDDCKLGCGYYYTCAVCGKTDIKKTLTLGKHSLAVDSITEPTESTDGVINYKCTKCNYTEQSEPIPYGTHYVTVDGVKYPALNGIFVTPFNSDNSFVGYYDGTKFIDGNTVLEVNSDIELKTVSFSIQMRTGASIRFNNPTGVRFYTEIDKTALSEIENLGATVQLGTLISPKNIMNFEDLRLDMKNDKVNVLYNAREWFTEDDFVGFVGSLVNIKDINVNREFVGRGYATITLGDYIKTIYANYGDRVEKNNTRTICYIAHCIKSSSSFDNLTDYNKEIVSNFASKYTQN